MRPSPAAAALLLSACAPHLEAFRADATPVCNGSATTVQWQFSGTFLGSTHLSSSQSAAEKVPATGSRRFVVKDSLVVDVVASRLGTTPGHMVIHTFPSDTNRVVAFIFNSVTDDSLTVTYSLTWDPRYRLGRLRNITGWPVRISHAGVTVTLADSAETDAFAGRAGEGAWDARMPTALPAGTTGVSPRPREVRTWVHMTCDSTTVPS